MQNLKLENKKLLALIEAQSQAETKIDAANAEEMSSLCRQVRELEMQLSRHHAGAEVSSLSQRDASQLEMGKAAAESNVKLYLERQGPAFLKGLFDKFAEIVCFDTMDTLPFTEGQGSSNPHQITMLKSTGLQMALLELGVQMEFDQVEKLLVSMDLHDHGGLDFEEFKRAVQQPATPLEQWVSMLPINGMLSRSFPVCGGPVDQVLRVVSKLGADEIHATVDVCSRALRDLLLESSANLQQMFSRVDEKAAEAAKVSYGPVAKFKTFKMSTGTVADYVGGISGRVGMYLCLLIFTKSW